ncbi:MAG TPA: UvrB/UvrC motif-containing protein [Selenomonadales bacterium]|nr:UvrB/UvrC motif-containing protein [Selenomonadales bacterium]
MLCDDCKERPASVHITKINNNKKTEKHLCDICAQKSGELTFSTEAQHTVQDFLKSMFSYGFSSQPAPRTEYTCPHCGMSYSDFSRGGKIGCSQCFAAFGERLKPLLRRIHGTSSHTGKVPKRNGGKLAMQRKLQQLRQELDRHVCHEEYEQAARVRDEIRLLEKEITK